MLFGLLWLSSGCIDYTASIRTHADTCAESLGPVPSFDCRDGEPVHLTLQGAPIPVGATARRCDQPTMLSGECDTTARVGRIAGERPEVTFVYLCRGTYEGGQREFPLVVMIGHDQSTGDTCYWQSVQGDDPVFPSPQTAGDPPDVGERLAENVWMTPQTVAGHECGSCHGMDPFVHSPWIDTAVLPGTDEPVIPYVYGGPYRVLGRHSWWWETYRLDLPGHPCASCHDIGEETCEYLEYSVGEGPPVDHGTGVDESYARWMPPPPAQSVSDADLEWLRSCCRNPAQLQCGFERVRVGRQ